MPSALYGDIKFDPSESSDISVEQSKAKVSHARSELSWLPDRNLQAVEDLVNGCGMIRTNGRIAFSFNYHRSRQNIKRQLDKICSLTMVHNKKYELIGQDVEVNIVFSIAGGTGSGNFIDMAYLVKDIFKEKALPETSKIVGYMVLPDVYDAQLVFGKEKLFPNACASLVDLDYLMHYDFTQKYSVNYLTQQCEHEGKPFNTIVAIGNTNQNGAVVSDSDNLSELMSMAMVVSAGELSSGASSIFNNLERDINGNTFNIKNKRATLGTLGMSAITFRATELTNLYRKKVAREVAASLLLPGNNVDVEATVWIDTEGIREDKGKDDVINKLHSKEPGCVFSEVYDKTNPKADVDTYLRQENVAINVNKLNEKINELKNVIGKSFNEKIRNIVNSRGPVTALEFVEQLRLQIEDSCLKEMREELYSLQEKVASNENAIKSAIEEYKYANKKFFGKKSAVQDALETLCASVSRTVITDREIHRRNGAITFYTWLLNEINDTKARLHDIENVIKSACQLIRNEIASINSSLSGPRGLFEVDLTKPYIERVNVDSSDIDINQFVLSLPAGCEISAFDKFDSYKVAELLYDYSNQLPQNNIWESLSVEGALAKLPKEEIEGIIRRAIDLSSPMCSLNFRGLPDKQLYNYYFVGVQEQSYTRLRGDKNGDIINFDECIPAGEMHETDYSSIGSRERIVIYHQYGVFPTYAIAGTATYRSRHDAYMSNPIAYSCFIDEDLRIKMEREGFSVIPQEPKDDSLELWVKGLIFGLITRDEDGVYYYIDKTNKDMALWDYKTSLNTQYRDEAFKGFKRNCNHLQMQYESYLANRLRKEGDEAINVIIADAKNNYLSKYSLNDLTPEQLKNPLYKDIASQLTAEVEFVNKEL